MSSRSAESPPLSGYGLAVDPDDHALFYERGWWREQTLLDDLAGVVAATPDKTALIGHRAADGTIERISYSELAQMVERIAGGLIELGVEPGDVVCFQLPNWWQFVALSLACARAQAVVSPIIPIHRRREVEFVLRLTESKLLVVPDAFRRFDHAAMALELLPEIDTLQHVAVIGEPRDGALSFEQHFLDEPWEGRHAARLAELAPRSDDFAEIQFTSGTTGEPKGVAHSFNTQYARARALFDPLALDADDTVLMASPLSHDNGFLAGYVAPVMCGMTSVLQDVWEPHTMLDLVEATGVVWSMGTTPFVVDAIRAQRERRRDLSTLRYFACGGAPIPPAVALEAKEVLGTSLIAIWGLTENGGATITRPEDGIEAATESDGRAVDWMTVRVIDESGVDVPPGTVGKIVTRGAAQTIGYFKRPEVFRSVHTPDGWFDTGDLGRLDAKGNLRITGRVKDLIIRGGENVPVAEVEAALYTHPAVDDVSIVAYPDERLGERACAVVVASAGQTLELSDLTAHLEELGMSKTYWPERLWLVDELPRTLSGKVQKFKLRQALAEGREETA